MKKNCGETLHIGSNLDKYNNNHPKYVCSKIPEKNKGSLIQIPRYGIAGHIATLFLFHLTFHRR